MARPEEAQEGDESRYARHHALDGFGLAAQDRLRAASVLVLGCGGLGSPVITYLAAAGVGRLTLVDDDVVSLSNLQRQVLHTTADVGRPKAASAAERARALNPDVGVVEVGERLTPSNADELLAGHDLAVDATDRFSSRRALRDAAARAGIPLVYGAVGGWSGQLTVLEPTRDLVDVFGELDDAVEPVPGILASLPGVVGAGMATEALKLLTATGSPLCGRLALYDARTGAWRTLTLPPLETT